MHFLSVCLFGFADSVAFPSAALALSWELKCQFKPMQGYELLIKCRACSASVKCKSVREAVGSCVAKWRTKSSSILIGGELTRVAFFSFQHSEWLNGFMPDDLEYETSDESLSPCGPQRCSDVCSVFPFWPPRSFGLQRQNCLLMGSQCVSICSPCVSFCV